MTKLNVNSDLDNVFVVYDNTKEKDLMNTKKKILISREEYRLISLLIPKLSGLDSDDSIFYALLDILNSRDDKYLHMGTSYYVWFLKMFKAIRNGYVVDTTKRFFVRVPYTENYYYLTNIDGVVNTDGVEKLIGSLDNPYPEDIYYFCFTEKELKERGLDNPIFEKIEFKYPEDEE